MYLCTLQNDQDEDDGKMIRTMVAIANTRKRADRCAVGDEAIPAWEITRAQKCE